jgi:hypothetical protein
MRLTICFFLLLIVAAACDKKKLKGEGDDVTDTVEMAAFSHVLLKSNSPLIIEKSNNYDVIITGHPDLVGAYRPQISGDTLTLEYDPYYTSVNDDNIRLVLRMPYLYGLQNNGKASVTVLPGFHGDRLVAGIDGPGNISFAAGNYTRLDAVLKGPGDFTADQLVCDSVYAYVSAGGTMDVHALYYIYARVNGAGTINYYGAPDSTDTQATGGGVINRK